MSTIFDQSFETNALYMDKTFTVNVHYQSFINNVDDSHMHDDIANNSICAPNYLDLKLNNKGFKIGCLNV